MCLSIVMPQPQVLTLQIMDLHYFNPWSNGSDPKGINWLFMHVPAKHRIVKDVDPSAPGPHWAMPPMVLDLPSWVHWPKLLIW